MKEALTSALPLWSRIRGTVTVLQGTEDDLVPPGNATSVEKYLTASRPEVIRLPGANHFIPWEQRKAHPMVCSDYSKQVNLVSI